MLEAQIIDAGSGAIDPELTACLGEELHAALFAHAGLSRDRFPLFTRIREYHAGAEYMTVELEALIAEVEEAALLFGAGSSVCRFLEPFHSMCCLALLRGKIVTLQDT